MANNVKRPRGIVANNLTDFFTRELFMYSLGDIKFKKPISLKKMAYATGFLLCYSLPLMLVFGLRFNPFWMAIMFGPPIPLANLCVKPAFGGKNLIDFTKTMWSYTFQPKGWTDLNPNNEMDRGNYKIESEIWISRRRELRLLATLKEKEKEIEAAEKAKRKNNKKISIKQPIQGGI